MFERLKGSYEELSYFLLKAYRLSLRHPRKVLLFFALVTAVLLAGMFRLKTLLALEDVVDPSFASKIQLNALFKDYKVHNSMILVLKRPGGGWTDESLCAVNKWLVRERIENSNILSSASPFDLRKSHFQAQYLSYPRILHLSCLEESGAASTPDSISKQIHEIQESPWGFSFVGQAGDDWLIQFDLIEAPAGTRYGSFDPQMVESIQKSFAAEVKQMPVPLVHSWVGTADFQYYLYVGLKRVNVLNLALLLLLIVMFRWMFGTWRAGILFCASILITGIICYGLMGWIGIPVDILSKSLFLMTAVAALEDFVYLSARTIELNGNWRQAWRKILMPGFLTSLTTALGFLSICVSDLQIIRRFGFWAAVGSMTEWIVVFILFPALFKLFPWWSHFTRKTVRNGYEKFNRWKFFKIPRKFSYALLLVFFFVPTAFLNLNVKDVPLEMFTSDHPFKKGISDIKDRNGWEAQVSLVFEPQTKDAEIQNIMSQIQKIPVVVRSLGSLDFNHYYSQGTQDPLYQDLVLSELKSASFMKNWISPQNGHRYNLFLREGDTESVFNLENQVKEICKEAGCYISGVPVVYSEFSKKVPETLLESFALSILLVAVILIWLAYCKQAISQVHWILLSSFWGPGLMFLLIAILGIKVNFLTCIFASVLVGLTGDNAIQFLVASNGRSLNDGILKGGGAALVSGFLMSLSSLVFIGSYFVPPRTFGLLLMAGFLASTLGDYWLLQALVRKEKQ